MTTWIAFLRGINVGGRNMLSMKKLVPSLANLGFEDSISYLNSGNLIFRSNDAKEAVVEESSETTLKKRST